MFKKLFLKYNGLIKVCQILLIAFLLLPFCVNGGLVEDLNQQIKEHQAKQTELEKKAQEYQQIIAQKQSKIDNLNDQITVFDAKIGKLETEIQISEDKTNQINTEIIKIEFGLDKTEEDIIKQKNNLAEIIQFISEYDNTTELEMILQSEDFSDFFNQLSYLEDLQDGVQQRVENLKLLKNKLISDKQEREDKKTELQEIKKTLSGQKKDLDGERSQKESLLKYTRGEESKYQAMLENIEEQKRSLLGDINQLRQLKAAELARLKETQDKPPSEYWASLNWYFSQDDPQWGDNNIGFSKSKMSNYGCAITSVAMVFNKIGVAVTPGQLAREPIFYYDLIVWPRSWSGGVECVNCPPPHSSVFDWSKLDKELAAGNPVIVFVRAKGRNGGHYVVVHHKTNDERYVVHDPLFGANIYLDSTQVYISNLYNTETYLDQMIVYH